MLELAIREEVFTNLPQIIEFNFDELSRELDIYLEKYKNLAFAESDIPEAKEIRAKLNKLSEAIDSKRKEIKKQWNEPYDRFEKKMKSLIEKVNQPKSEIDNQIKAFEESERQEKIKAIEAYFNEKVENLPLELSSFYSPEWLNKTFSLKKVKEAIDGTITNFRNGLTVIEKMNSPYEAHIKQLYCASLDLATAITRGEKQGQALQAMKAKVIEIPRQDKPVQVASVPNTVEMIDIRIFVTAEQKAALKEFLTANNIKHTKVPHTAVS